MATIGTFDAILRLQAAAFIREFNKAAQATARNTNAMSRSMAALDSRVAAAGRNIRNTILGFASVAGVRSFQNLAKAAVQSADEIASASRRMGVSAEELQRFRFAAEQADVGVSELTAAFRTFQKQLAEGKIQAEGETVLDKFQDFIKQIEDAPTRMEAYRLAVDGAGKAAGAAMGLAADGAENFRKNMDEAVVVSNELIAKGDVLDDKMATIQQAISTGFATGILQSFGSELDTTKSKMEALANSTAAATRAVTFGFGLAAIVVKGIGELAEEVRKAVEDIANNGIFANGLNSTTGGGPLSPIPWWGGAGGTGPGGKPMGEGSDPAKAIRDAANAQREWNQTMQEGMGVWESTLGPMGTYQNEINRLTSLYEQGAISAETFGTAQRMAAASAIQPWLGVADTIAGALGTLFGENKAVAVAQAIINTAQGITAALAQGGMFGWAQAAAIAAAGAAQIATIMATEPKSTGKKPSVSKKSGGKSGGANESVGDTVSKGPQQSVTLIVKGDVFGPEHFRKIVKGINGVTQDGTVLLRMG